MRGESPFVYYFCFVCICILWRFEIMECVCVCVSACVCVPAFLPANKSECRCCWVHNVTQVFAASFVVRRHFNVITSMFIHNLRSLQSNPCYHLPTLAFRSLFPIPSHFLCVSLCFYSKFHNCVHFPCSSRCSMFISFTIHGCSTC